MKLGTKSLFVSFEDDFIIKLDEWKGKILNEGISSRLKKLIEEDLKNINGK